MMMKISGVSITLIVFLVLGIIGAILWTARERRNFAAWAHRDHSFKNFKFKWVKLASLLCGCYALTVTFTETGNLGVFGGVRNPNTGWVESNNFTQSREGIYQYQSFINPAETVTRSVVAFNIDQSILLGISRFSGFSLYPYIILIMFTKYRATLAFLDRTPLSVFIIQDTHALHVFAGWYIFFDSLIHTLCHCLRWIDQGNIHLLWSNPQGCNPSGISGMFVVLSTFICVLPMTVFRTKIRFEVRKYAHYFFFVFCIAMTVHAPFWALPNAGFCRFIFPILIIWYILDATFVKFFMTERIGTVEYQVLDSGVEVSMPVSERFQKNLTSGGYGYVMAPWSSKHQWHAFSIYENPLDPSIRHMFFASIGDWTKDIQKKTRDTQTARPLWISGPFPSPYNNGQNFDNMICVASGVGITPALSAIEAFRETRRVNLVWAVRDPSMLVFFLENAKLDDDSMNLIFYTGKDPLPSEIENYNISHDAHLEIIHSRANISRLVPNIINYFENPASDFNKYEVWKKREQISPSTSMNGMNTLYDPEKGGYRFSNVSWVSPASEIMAKTPTPKPSTSVTRYESKAKPARSKATDMTGQYEDDNNGTGRTDRTYTDHTHRSMVDASGEVLSLDLPPEECAPPDRQSQKKFAVPRKNMSVYTAQNFNTAKNLAEMLDDNTVATKRRTINTNGPDRTSRIGRQQAMSSAIGHPEVWEENKYARSYVESEMPAIRKETWGLLYCGGRNPLLHQLVKESKELDIPLFEEAFNW